MANHVTLTWPRFARRTLLNCACAQAAHSSEQRPKLKWASFSAITSVQPETPTDARLSPDSGDTLHVDLQSTFLNRIINSTCQADLRCVFFVKGIQRVLSSFRNGINGIEEKLGIVGLVQWRDKARLRSSPRWKKRSFITKGNAQRWVLTNIIIFCCFSDNTARFGPATKQKNK